MKTIEVGCAIIQKEGRLLIAQRHLDDSFGGSWEFPGGKREEGETMENCLVREIEEELGIKVRPRKFLYRRDHKAGDRKISLFFYFCDWLEGVPKARDCRDFKWVSCQEIARFPFLPGDEEVLEDLVRNWNDYFKAPETCR